MAQLSPEKLGFEEVILKNKTLGDVHYYHYTKGDAKSKPLLLYLDGPVAYPLFQMMENGKGSTIIFDYLSLAEKYHILFISKRGVPFKDSVGKDPSTNYPLYQTPDEYTKKLSCDWLVQSADLVIKDAKKKWKIDKRKVAILGFSEGFQVGCKLISLNKSITHALLFVGDGLIQSYDFSAKTRLDAQLCRISDLEAQHNIDSLNQILKEIKIDPHNTEKLWKGHSYLRWSSFWAGKPIDHLLNTKIQVYIASCTFDQNTFMFGLQYLYLRSIVALYAKKNVMYNSYFCDHDFNKLINDEQGKVLSAKNQIDDFMNEAITWLNKQ
ncbi:MAG: hypothetical protein IPH93_17525 [Saprospiraceae bacterium]|nr:hypothetical protein [Saprospiraceae bacterium]MBK7809736.1 hypothetical protein [Saprospiraceae bacterium]MBK9632154.1 hypothetical protein [Saprospiraceae bacterium]